MNVVNQTNFLAKNYRPKCDMCSKLCNMEWYMQTSSNNLKEDKLSVNPFDAVKENLLVCEDCLENGNLPKGLSKENFEIANFFNIVNPAASKIIFSLFFRVP